MSILLSDRENEVARINQEARLDQITIDGIAACSTACLDFQRDPELRMKRVNFVRQVFGSHLTE